MAARLELHRLEGAYAVRRLEATAPTPDWAVFKGFVSISRGEEELAVVCRERRVPHKAERDWRCFRRVGPFNFVLTGILAALLNPRAWAGVAISTHNTDRVLSA